MRFHIGLSKSMKFSTLFKFLLAIISIFFLNSCVVHADSFSVFQTWAWCPLNAQHYESTGCTQKGANDTEQTSVNGLAHVRFPKTSVLSSMGKNGKYSYASHSEIFKWGGTSDCSTGSTIRFDVDIVLKDNQSIFSSSSLDYNAWPGGSGGSPVLRATQSFSWNNYYSWLGNNSSFSNNQLGVSVTKNDYNYNFQQCSFVSYGSNKSVKFLCSIDSGNTGYYIRVNEPNYTGNNTGGFDDGVSSSSPVIITGVQVNMLNDPCSQYGTDQSSVVGAITDQTNSIMSGISDIISNNNSNTQSITGAIGSQTGEIVDNLDGIKDNQDITNGLLQDIKDGQEVCNKIYASDFTNEGLLDTNTGIVNNNSSYSTSAFIRFNRIKTISAVNYTMCFYNSEKVKISCTNNFVSVPDNTVYYRISILKNQANAYLESCGSGQEVDSSGINKYLNKINQMNSPVTDLLTIPINFILGITDGVSNDSCTPYTVNFTIPGATRNQNKTWTFPCFDTIYNSNDSQTRNIVNLIDSIFTFVLIYGISMGAIRFYEDLSSLEDTFDQQYKGGRH